MIFIVALIVAVYAVLSCYDFNHFKSKIALAVKDATGREITFGGDIRLRIGFTPTVVMEEVSFQNAQWGSRPELAKIRRFEVQISLLPLIGGNIEVKRLILVEPDVLVETDNAGKSNLEFKVAEKLNPLIPKEKALVEGQSTVPLLIFNKVWIENGRFTYKDGQSGKTYTVVLNSLNAVATGNQSPFEVELKGTYNSEPFEVSGTLGPLIALTSPNKRWFLKVTVKGSGATATVEGTIGDVLNAKDLVLTISAEGKSVPKVVRLADVTGMPDMGPFKLALKVSDPGGKLTIEQFDLHVGTEELVKVKLTGAVKDPLAKRGIEVNFAVRGNDLSKLEKLVGQPLPLKCPFDFSGHAFDLTLDTYKVNDLKVSLGDSEFGGSVEINLAARRPRMTAVLSSQKLDLRPVLSKGKGIGGREGQSAEQAAKQDKVFPDDLLPLNALKQADAKFKIRAGRILLPRLALTDLVVDMVLEDGHLILKPLSFGIGGGTVDGHFDLRLHGKVASLALALKIHQFRLGQMFKELEINDNLEGKFDAEIELSGHGSSVASLMAGLNGKTILVMGKGRIDNKYFDLLGSDISSSAFRLLNPLRDEMNYTEFNCFVSRFDIKDGLADSTALVFDTSSMSVAGGGRVNLKTEELNFSFKPTPKKGLGLSGVGKLSLSFGELAKPLKLAGTIANPTLAIDPTKTAITLGKAVGGVVLFGPVGIVAALATGRSDSKNPCLCAIEAAEKGVRVSGVKKPEKKKSSVKKASLNVTDGIKIAVGSARRTLKKFFSRISANNTNTLPSETDGVR